MRIRGHRHNAETLAMKVEGSGPTLTKALEDAMGTALQVTPEAREVNISEYTFEVETKSFPTIGDPTPGRKVSWVLAEVDLYVELREAVRERRGTND